MQKEIPKPFLQISGRTVLEHTLRRFLPLEGLRQIIIATSEEYRDTANRILKDLLPEGISYLSLVGGKERQHSIYNTLGEVSGSDLVIIHDAVRPFVGISQIKNCCRVATEVGAAILGVPVKDTIKRIDEQQLITETPDRSFLWQAQTPQVFATGLIKKAYEKAMRDDFIGTDDASLVERLDHEIKMVRGDQSNFKITYPLDFELAKLLIKKENQ